MTAARDLIGGDDAATVAALLQAGADLDKAEAHTITAGLRPTTVAALAGMCACDDPPAEVLDRLVDTPVRDAAALDVAGVIALLLMARPERWR